MFGELSARQMSPSARHKQSLVQQDRNPGFHSGNLYFLWGAAAEEIVRFPRRKRRRGVGGDELNWVNLGRVDPATLQATKIARGVKTCVWGVQFFQKISEKMRDESSNMKSRIQEDIRRAVSVKASEEATWKGIKVQQKYFCVIKISGFVVQKKAWGVNIFSRPGGWKRRRKTWAIKVGLDACCRGVNPARFKMIQDYPLGWYRLRGRSVDGEKRSTG